MVIIYLWVMLCIYIYIYDAYVCVCIKVKLATLVEGNPKAPFSTATTPRALFLSLDCSTLPMSAKQGDIKYHFLSFWDDSTWD